MSPIQLTPYTTPAQQPSEMGIENLSMRVEPSCSGKSLNDLSCASSAIRFSPWATNSWARNLDLTGFNHGIDVMRSASRITVTSVVMNRYGPTDSSAGYAIDVAIDGTQVLVHNVKNKGDGKSWSVATESLTPGPNVCIGYEAQQPTENIGIEPHQRWAHGFLNEGSKVVSVVYRNRGNAGTGHGWTMNNGRIRLPALETSCHTNLSRCFLEFKLNFSHHARSTVGTKLLLRLRGAKFSEGGIRDEQHRNIWGIREPF